jgi:hypothetical protein
MMNDGESMNPDLDQAAYFLDLLGPEENFTFQTFSDVSEGSGSDRLAITFHGKLSDHADTLVSLNRQGAGIFVMINEGDGKIHPGSRTCRTTKNVVRVRALFVDLDGSPVEPVMDSNPAPGIVVNSSPQRFHAYWPVKDVKLGEFNPLQKKLARKFDADPSVCDLPRVLRVPGFYHQKAAPFMSQIVLPRKELQ